MARTLTQHDLESIQTLVAGGATNAILTALNDLVVPRFEAIEAVQGQHTKLLNQHSRTLAEHSQLLSDQSRQLTTINTKVDYLTGEVTANSADIKELYKLV